MMDGHIRIPALADWDEMYQAVGDPDQIRRDAARIPMPPDASPRWHVRALCLRGHHEDTVARVAFRDEEARLPDGSATTARDWTSEKYARPRSPRRRWDCATCGDVTAWVSVGVSHQREVGVG